MATKEEQREYQRKWIAKRRADFFADKICVRCGNDETLELDHIDPAQKVSHNVWSWSAARRDQEISKCQVLCHDCHLAKTVENGDMSYGEQRNLKLTEQDIRDIRGLHESGFTYRSIGEKYQIDYGWVGHIVRGTGWARSS